MSFDIFQQGPSVYIPFLIFSILITLILYGAFPICFSKIRKKQITKKKYKILCFVINFVVMLIFKLLGHGDFSNAMPYILWTSIFTDYGIKVLDSKSLITNTTPHTPPSWKKKNEENITTLSNDNDSHVLNNLSSSDVTPTEEVLQLNTSDMHPLTTDNIQKKKRGREYCSLCGNKIDATTKKCSGCGKQYFKGIRINKKIFMTTIIILFVISVSCISCFQYITIQDLNEKISTLERQSVRKDRTISHLEDKISDLQNEIKNYKPVANFVDRHVVFVEDDGTRLYHKYECYKFKGESFWAYNIEAAKSYGYKKCSSCH